jgi:hypothetical protein
MVKLIQHCRCTLCDADIQFDIDDYPDLSDLPEINCPKCGMATKLYATSAPERRWEPDAVKADPPPLTTTKPVYVQAPASMKPNMATAWGWTWRVLLILFLIGAVVAIVVSVANNENKAVEDAVRASHPGGH